MILASVVALLFLALPALAPEAAAGLRSVPRTPAVLVPLLLAAGLPRRAGSEGNRGPLAVAAALAAAAPCLALAARTDAARGVLDAGTLAAGVALAALLGIAAGRVHGPRAAAHGAAWLALVVLGPLLALALTWGDAGGAAPAWALGLRSLSPLAWAWDRAAGVSARPWAPLVASAGLAALALGRPGTAAPSEDTP